VTRRAPAVSFAKSWPITRPPALSAFVPRGAVADVAGEWFVDSDDAQLGVEILPGAQRAGTASSSWVAWEVVGLCGATSVGCARVGRHRGSEGRAS
jgi:hypothetical protein